MPIRDLARVLLVAVLLTPALRARAVAGAVSVSVTPAQLTLEPGARATLRITAPEPPVIGVNIGRIEGMEAIAPGSYRATYVPPAETYPQVAIVTVTTSGAFAWAPLPLAGTGDVAVSAPPNGNAFLTIGKTRFGPVRADASGRAVIHVVVPPGAKYAMTGNRRMSLETPEVSHVHVTTGRSTVAADASTTVVVRAFAVTPDGRPRRRAPIIFSASAGRVSAPREVEPGAFEASWTVPPGAGSATVTAALRDEAASTARATLTREASVPKRIRIDVDRDSVAAGESAFEFAITIEDGAGNPVEDAVPRASTNVGTLLGFVRGAPGHWVARVAVPERLYGTSRLELVATAGDAVAHRSVTIVPGPPADIAVDMPTAGVAGKANVTFDVATTDRFGNPTDGSSPTVTAALGKVDAPVHERTGVYKVVYRPPLATSASVDEITVRAGSAERISRVQLHPQRRTSLLEVAPVGGIAIRTGGGSAPVAGAEVSLWGQFGAQELGLALNGSWYDFNPGTIAVAGPGNLSVLGEQTYVALTLSPSWRHAVGSWGRVWASVGGGMTRVHSMTIVTGQPQVDESKWVPTGTAAVSLGAKLWGGYPFVEIRASYVADPGFANLSGAFWPIFLQAGYRFDAF